MHSTSPAGYQTLPSNSERWIDGGRKASFEHGCLGQRRAMIFLIDGSGTPWRRVYAALSMFKESAYTNSIYCYLMTPKSLVRQADKLRRELDLEDYCTIMVSGDQVPDADVTITLAWCSDDYVQSVFSMLLGKLDSLG
jgi:hypothetical protein